MHDLTKDFGMVRNLKHYTKDDQYLLCEVEPTSILYEPIEALRKLLLKESEDEEVESSEDDLVDEEGNLRPKKKKDAKLERSQMEVYMDAVE